MPSPPSIQLDIGSSPIFTFWVKGRSFRTLGTGGGGGHVTGTGTVVAHALNISAKVSNSGLVFTIGTLFQLAVGFGLGFRRLLGAGLGFLTMARDASEPLEFEFVRDAHNPDATIFCIKAII